MAEKIKRTYKPRPKTTREAVNESIPEVIPGSKPIITNDNVRAEQLSVKDADLKDYSIGFDDIDAAVFYYFDNVIKPSVTEDGNLVKVPVMYANPERWKSAQDDLGIRDKDGKILFPVIAIKKDTIEKVRDITSKVDGNSAKNFHTFEQRYSKENPYNNFSALTNRRPVKSYGVVVVPDYYRISYSCAVYVNYNSDLNKILEAIGYASDSYWGDPKRFTFMSRIDSMPITQEVNVGDVRKVYSIFNITLQGHIIPESINQYMSVPNRFFSKAQLNFSTEVVSKSL
jgi:hypothetical protein